MVRRAHPAFTLAATALRAVTVYVARRGGRFGGCYHGSKKNIPPTARPTRAPEPHTLPTCLQLAATLCAQASSANLGKRPRVEAGGGSTEGLGKAPDNGMDMDLDSSDDEANKDLRSRQTRMMQCLCN